MASLRVGCAAAVILTVVSPATGQLPPDVDHYLCYKIAPTRGSSAFTAVDRTLRDTFQPATTTFHLKKVATFCTPASKNAEPIVHPNDYQVGYRIQAASGSARFVKQSVQTLDQFGARSLDVLRPDGLLVPSNAGIGAASVPPYVPSGVRHYKCYRARQKHFVAPAPATVADVIGTASYTFRKVTKLCTPVDKAGEDPSAPGDPGHLVCLRARKSAFPGSTAATNNQIRPEQLDLLRPIELCLPAIVTDPPPTTSTTTTATSSTSTSSSTIPQPCGAPGSAPAPLCWGTCPAATPICAATVNGCECVAGSTPCGSASFPTCDGACAPDEACGISLSLGCTCQFQGIPCAAAYAFTGTCGGVCPADYTCAGPVFTPDGDGCFCVPNGSTCHLTCGADPGAGNCPPGQTCSNGIPPGICLCQ